MANDAPVESDQSDATNSSDFAEAVQPFGDDDLGRVQGILFGDHARRTSERIDTLEAALLGVMADLRDRVENEFAALNRRLDNEAEMRAKAVSNVGERVSEEEKKREQSNRLLRKDLDSSHEAMTSSLDGLEQRASQSLATARGELSSEIEANAQSLTDLSVAKGDLANALRRAAEEISGSAAGE